METEQNRDIILTDCFSAIAMTAKAKSKYHLFGGFYCAELEAVFSAGLPERNTAPDLALFRLTF